MTMTTPFPTVLEKPPSGQVIAWLDGSSQSAGVARIAARFARWLDRRLVLYRTLGHRGPDTAPPDPLDWYVRRQEARHDLFLLRDSLPDLPADVAIDLREGDWLDARSEWTDRSDSLLVVSAVWQGEHRRTLEGAVRVLSEQSIGQLLLVPAGYRPAPEALGRIVVPIDGSRFAEAALAEAVNLARRCRAELVLVHAIPEACLPEFGPPASADIDLRLQLDRRNENAALDFLEGMRRRLSAQGLVVRSLCLKGDARSVLAHAMEEERPGLVVLSAKGQGGRRCHDLTLGSTASYLVDHAISPIMLVGGGLHAGRRADDFAFAPEERMPPAAYAH